MKHLTRARIIAVLAALLTCSMANAALTPEEEAALIKEWWYCDKASNDGLLSSGEAAYCSEIYEKLLKEKFGGDFNKFLEWWRTNKPY